MKINFYKIFFLMAYIFIIIPYSFSELKLDQDFLYVLYILSLFMLIGLFIYEYIYKAKFIKKNTLIFLIIVFILGVISSVIIDNTIMLRTFLFICTFRNIKFKDFIKCDFYIRLIIVLLVFIFWNFNIAGSGIFYRDEIIRFSFGFNHPNKFGLYIMLMCMDLTYLFANASINKKYWIITLMAFLSFFVYYFANSRASFIVILFCIIAMLLSKRLIYKIINTKFIKFVIKNSFLIMTIFTLSLVVLYRNENFLATKINSMSSGRIYMASEYLKNYDVSLFGSKIIFYAKNTQPRLIEYFVLDNNFVYFLIHFGIIFYTIMIFLFRKTFKKLYETKKYLLIILLFIYVLYGFMESTLLKFYLNPFLLLFNYLFFDDQKIFNGMEKIEV